MTRIVHFFEPPTHGVPNYVSFLAEHQAASGHDVHIVGPSRRKLPGVTWLERPIDRRRPRSVPRVSRWVADYADSIDADVIHAHSFFAGLGIRSTSASQPIFYTPHAWAFAEDGAQKFAAIATERAMMRRTAKVLCVSQAAANEGLAALGRNAPITSIGSAINLDRFQRSTADDQHALHPYAVCVGRISHQKGQLSLAEIWNEQMKDTGLKLVFVGDGHPDLTEDQYPYSDGLVHFVGPSQDVPKWLSAATFAVQPSRWEAMSLATVEALACGTPVIATDVAGMSEAIVEGPEAPAGAVVPTIADIIAEARRRVEESSILTTESANARKRAVARFSIDRLVSVADHEYTTALDPASTVDLTVVEPSVASEAVPIDLASDDFESTEVAA